MVVPVAVVVEARFGVELAAGVGDRVGDVALSVGIECEIGVADLELAIGWIRVALDNRASGVKGRRSH